MEKKKKPPMPIARQGVMEARLRRRDPAGDEAFDPEGEGEEEGNRD